MSSVTPSWVDRSLYPFASHHHDTADGRLHYVDEGRGPALLLVHGTPTWSFLYRHLIAGLSRAHRVIAVDHLGFGLSDKPREAPYTPADHARRLATLIDRLGLRDVTLVVHDFGGPIGLSYAIDHPERIARLVLFNTWMWSLADLPSARRASRLAASPVGRFLYRSLNVSPRLLIPAVMGDRRKLTPAVHRHYVAPFPSPREREAPWVLARELLGSSDWYDALWQRRDRLADIPALLLWGMRDPTFGPAALDRWMTVLRRAEVHRHASAGHLVQEEEGAALVAPIAGFVAGRAGTTSGAVPVGTR